MPKSTRSAVKKEKILRSKKPIFHPRAKKVSTSLNRSPPSLIAQALDFIPEKARAPFPIEEERGTGFEPATTSLEGWCSATELPPQETPRRAPALARPRPERSGNITRSTPSNLRWWAGRDSNPRRREPTDLQSAPFGRLGTCPSGRPEASGTRPGRRAPWPEARDLEWSWRSDLHRQPPVYKTGALLLSYASEVRRPAAADSRGEPRGGQAKPPPRRPPRSLSVFGRIRCQSPVQRCRMTTA